MEAADMLREAERLIATLRWLSLGTIERDGSPLLSYVPFACADAAFAIVVSRLAAHTTALLRGAPASVLLVDDRPQSDAYARARFSIAVTPEPRPAQSPAAERLWSILEARQGATVAVLRSLPDFEAIALAPVAGRLILGFASAHDIDGAAIAEILRAG